MNVDLHIEELILHGFTESRDIGDAVERELSRLFGERGVPPSLTRARDIPRLDAGAFEIERNLGADAVGARVARSLYKGMA